MILCKIRKHSELSSPENVSVSRKAERTPLNSASHQENGLRQSVHCSGFLFLQVNEDQRHLHGLSQNQRRTI